MFISSGWRITVIIDQSVCLLLLVVPVIALCTSIVWAQDSESVYRDQMIVVQFDHEIISGNSKASSGLLSFDTKATHYGVYSIERMFPFLDDIQHSPETKENILALSRTYYVLYSAPIDPYQVAQEFSKVYGVTYAEHVPIYHFQGDVTQEHPDDPLYDQQTYLKHLRLPEAWNIVKSDDRSTPVLIAIIDSGTEWQHEDLVHNVWMNEDEVPDNGIDDDLNGFIDDIYGINLANGDLLDNDPTADPEGPFSGFHGSATAGIASASSGNGIGISGAAWNAQLMHINAGCPSSDGVCYGYEGILYAAMNGADIINVSWGSEQTVLQLPNHAIQTLDLATDLGALVIAAAGNDQLNHDEYVTGPASYYRVLSVGATEKDSRRRAEFSNYGRSVNVFAPGVDILLTLPNDQYDMASGTSFATPLVAGIAALVKTRFPDISPDALREQLRLSGENMDGENPPFAGQLGRGFINALSTLNVPTLPSVRVNDWSWHDISGSSIINAGDDFDLIVRLTNYLADAQQLEVELIPEESFPYIRIMESKVTVGHLKQDASTNVTFRLKWREDVTVNQVASFYLRIQDGSFTDHDGNFHLGISTPSEPATIRALRALYQSTDGDQWKDNTGWKIDEISTLDEVSEWYGIQVTQSTLTCIRLQDNNLRGTLPGELSQIFGLQCLNLSNNSLTGLIPSELGQLSELEHVLLDGNSLSGRVPIELGQLTHLVSLSLQNNQFKGWLPRSLMQLNDLQTFNFSGQELCAPPDDEFQQWLLSIPNVDGPTCIGGLELATSINDQSFLVDTPINPLVLPQSKGGQPPFSHMLTPSLPSGLSFNKASRTISGTPTVIFDQTEFNYIVTDANHQTGTQSFSIEVIGSVSTESANLPQTFIVHGNYPNPFQHSTNIKLDLPWRAEVNVVVFDLMGREVLAIPPVYLEPRWGHILELRGTSLPSGVYVYRVHASSLIGTHKYVGHLVTIR